MKNSFGIAQALALGMCIGLVVSAASCGTKPPTSRCNKNNCATGCCDDDGTCYGADDAGVYSNDKCGYEGGVCNQCTASQVCQLGQCKLGGTAGGMATGGGSGTGGGSAGSGGGMGGAGGNSCSATNCPNGCCSVQGQCTVHAMQSFAKCGSGGATCAGCPVMQTCAAKDGGTGGVCAPAMCASCFDAAGSCRPENTMTNPNYCGSGGGLCARCAATEMCINGRCIGMSTQCMPSNCDGCCAGNTCIPLDGGISNSQCGINAQQCQTCNMPATCDSATGNCVGGGGTGGGSGLPGFDGGFPGLCDATSCPNGCCVFMIGCIPNGTTNPLGVTCGTGGAVCKACLLMSTCPMDLSSCL